MLSGKNFQLYIEHGHHGVSLYILLSVILFFTCIVKFLHLKIIVGDTGWSFKSKTG